MNTTTENTPGFNSRIRIGFRVDKNGRKRAFYISKHNPFRTFPLPVADAETFLATGAADDICAGINRDAILADLAN